MQTIIKAVEKHRERILAAERYIWANPETGYKEFKTSAYMEEQFRALGYDLVKPDGITGFCAEIDTGREGPTLMIVGELDSIICPAHPESNPETGAVHSCGHNMQCATLLGVAAALREEGMLDGLCGKIRLCAVPAEELLEIEYRTQLREAGKIRYFGGKSEFLSRGMFDGVDLAFMVHATTDYFSVRGGSVGCIAKKITYRGKAAHAGGAPWDGHNALYAANCGLSAINAIRETFKDEDLIRVHPIITSGGAMVNAIPGVVTMESYVRGRTFRAIVEANKRVNRALVGAALSLGTNVDIVDIPGYAPLENDLTMMHLAEEAFRMLDPDAPFGYTERPDTGSTDLGDLSRLMPVLHAFAPGMTGTPHGSDYFVTDPETACVKNAKWQLLMVRLLLGDTASRARAIVSSYRPEFSSKEEFLAFMDSLNDSGDRIAYAPDGTASVRFE
ncbi:MAG: amidohydrolase [Clostridia bacterium]|nr:amidohydrolase [Clostridia bacterium]MBQ9785777.1 amidohydrolase [Clostridia bacterium]